MRAKQLLYQLSYIPDYLRYTAEVPDLHIYYLQLDTQEVYLKRLMGVEPTKISLEGRCNNRYTPTANYLRYLAEAPSMKQTQ